ncbi:MAG: M42 family peptidase [Nanoarchaeota archaeon]|nr:M42 family peptidase [Nanoarchaeota archaeon]
MKGLLTLMDILSASGNENAIRNHLIKEIKPYSKNIEVDKFGNIIVHKKGKGTSIMLAAHMDEIGLMIQSISPKGVIYISMIGGIDPISCLNQHVKIKTKKGFIIGVVSTITISDSEEMEKVPTSEELIIDTGLTKKELEKLGISIGTFIEFEQKSTYLGNKDIICGKAADDRVGCYILLELIKKSKTYNTDIYFVFTVQEEIGLYGAKTSIYNIDPEWAIAIDVSSTNDLEENSHIVTRSIGKGPTLTIMDAEFIGNKCLNEHMLSIAKKKKIKIQPEVSQEGTTDALNISLSKGGIPTTVLGVAVRNLHSGISIVHRRDVEDAITVMSELLKNPPKLCL